MRAFETWLLSCLLNSLWQIPLLVAAASIAAWIVRRLGPRAEHRVWACALVLASVLPACSGLPWQWLRVPLAWTVAHHYGEARVSVVMGPGTGLGAMPLPTTLLAVLAAAYALLCSWFAARFLWRWWQLRALRRGATEVVLSGEASLFWQQCSAQFGIDSVSLATSSRVFGPVTMGIRRGLVLLPAGMLTAMPEADLRAVIAHEFAHIRRNDFLTNLLYECLALPVSYHPIFRIARQRMMETREMICDHMAAEVEGRNQYARSLLRLASRITRNRPARTHYAIGISDANTFERRLMRLTEKPTNIRSALRLAAISASIALGVATCASALALHVGVSGLAGDHNDAKPTGPINVAPGVMQAQRIGGPMPIYPPDAKKARIQGTVLLDAIIGKDGTVENLTVVSGPPALQASAHDAVIQWTYKPFLLNGDPVEVKTTISVIYSLKK